MVITTEQSLEAALALPDQERLEFVEARAVSPQPEDRPPLDESRHEFVRDRIAELRGGR